MTGTARRAILHVDMDAFYASVEQNDDASLRGRPVIVGGLGPRGVVSAASYEARTTGVHSAMPTGRARRLCPEAVFLRPRMDRYRDVSQCIFGVFHEITPVVEGLSLDEAFLDVTGSIRLFGSREDIGRLIRERILQRTGLQASVGMAHNKFLAKLASDADKPAGFVTVDPQDVHAFLDPMPVRRLWGIGRKTEPRLRSLGILTIGQLRRSDPGVLAEVLGNRAGHFLALARGEDEREVTAMRDDKSISHEVTFDRDVSDPRELRAEVYRQAEAVVRRLRGQHLVARTVQVKIRDRSFRTATRSLSLRAPTDSMRTVYGVARSLVNNWLGSNANTPVRLVGVGVSGLCVASPEDTGPGGRAGPDAAVDAVARRFGSDMLVGALGLVRKNKG